jgi:hypothetical protein
MGTVLSSLKWVFEMICTGRGSAAQSGKISTVAGAGLRHAPVAGLRWIVAGGPPSDFYHWRIIHCTMALSRGSVSHGTLQ